MKSGIVLGLCLTVLVGCAAKAEITPIQEEIRLLRPDGCTGPAELQEYVLVGKDALTEVGDILGWCQKEGLLPHMEKVELLFIPETLTCPDIPNATLQQYLMLISKNDFVFVTEQLEECAVNYEERERERDRSQHNAQRI